MKAKIIFTLLCLKLATVLASASILYVNVSNLTPVPPFQTWDTAATNIQDAIDAATNGDQILVTNGVYQTGGKVMAGDLTNRVALTKPVIVQSVNGPLLTSILGVGATNGNAAIRCAWLTNKAALIGFTLMGGATRSSGDTFSLEAGGGAWCASSNALVSNCLIASNIAGQYGGGIYQGTANACLIVSNGTPTPFGGATYQSVLNNCTIVSNIAVGAIYPVAMTNSILYFNGGSYGNYQLIGGSFSHCCTTPAIVGTGNFTSPPQLFADGIHLSSNSPCIGTGVNIGTGTDLFGATWSNPPSVGCAEWSAALLIGVPQFNLTSNPAGFTIGNFPVQSSSPCSFFWFKDGVLLQDDGHFNSTQTATLTAIGAKLADAGIYQVMVSNALGTVLSSTVKVVVHCVGAAGANPLSPYLNWSTAATNIQDAIAASAVNDIVLVTNGLYNSGGKSMDSIITNRVSIDKAILVQSVNGANATIIQGALDSTSTNGPGAIRCVWMTNNAILSGFTLYGGATRTATVSPNSSMKGGGVLGSSNNATVYGCTIAKNFAATSGGGAFNVTLNNCLITGNGAVGASGTGGGAASCNLNDCIITTNIAGYATVANAGGFTGGGADQCNLKNCFVGQNSSFSYGSGANGGTLINCTLTANTSFSSSTGYGAAVYGAKLTNCIVFGNFSQLSLYPNTNYANCTMAYCCADPLPSGIGNIGLNPQLIGDNFHLSATSPCIGAGLSNVVSGVDIDGQPWNNPPAIGCDEWHSIPVIGFQPGFQIDSPAHGLTFNVIAAGQSPLTYFWNKDGIPMQDDGHHDHSSTSALIVNNFGPEDAGLYQVVVSNAFGIATSVVTQVTIHVVNLASPNPTVPYATWTTAATNIQDAINTASSGEIVLVTNGIYATGGKIVDGDLTNRVVLDKAITVISVNGWSKTIIQGAWDPITTNGPGAVRCAYLLANGAMLTGFTLQNGATRATGDISTAGPLESGGAIFCNPNPAFNGIAANCMLSNNSAVYGGGIIYGTLNNSVVVDNWATQMGGGAFETLLNNCTVEYNLTLQTHNGAGTYGSTVRNSIVVNNHAQPPINQLDNHDPIMGFVGTDKYYSSCTSPTLGLSGANNINVDPQILDLFHLSITSPCRGAGNGLYASGTDIDGETWTNPPSIGCDEVIAADLVGPLSIDSISYQDHALVNRSVYFYGFYTGRAASTVLAFDDGTMATNSGAWHTWTNSGDYTVSFTVYNNDNPSGVSSNIVMHVEPLKAPQIELMTWMTNSFQFQFIAQTNASYTVQFTTNLVPPMVWLTLQNIYYSQGGVVQINDPAATNAARFYRVSVQ